MGSHDGLGDFGIDVVEEGIVLHGLTYLFDGYIIIEFIDWLGWG